MAKIVGVSETDKLNLESCPECGSLDVYWFDIPGKEVGKEYEMLCTCEWCDADWAVRVKIEKE